MIPCGRAGIRVPGIAARLRFSSGYSLWFDYGMEIAQTGVVAYYI